MPPFGIRLGGLLKMSLKAEFIKNIFAGPTHWLKNHKYRWKNAAAAVADGCLRLWLVPIGDGQMNFGDCLMEQWMDCSLNYGIVGSAVVDVLGAEQGIFILETRIFEFIPESQNSNIENPNIQNLKWEIKILTILIKSSLIKNKAGII
jgi:hypothetical protein